MNRIKCATFDKDMQDSIPKDIREKMKSDRAKAEKEQETKAKTLPIQRVVFSFLRGGKRKPKQTCKNCRFNCEDDHTCMNDCNVGSYYAEKGLNRICYEGELWEGK